MKLLDSAINRISDFGGDSESEHPEEYATILLVGLLSLITLMLLI